MKKILVLTGFLAMLTISSCTQEDDIALRFEPLRVISVNFPPDLQALETYQVGVTYLRPSSCHYFEGFDYEQTGEDETTVFLIASVFNDQPCQELSDEAEASFEFSPQTPGNYNFRFWQGKDTEGNDIYYNVSVNVE